MPTESSEALEKLTARLQRAKNNKELDVNQLIRLLSIACELLEDNNIDSKNAELIEWWEDYKKFDEARIHEDISDAVNDFNKANAQLLKAKQQLEFIQREENRIKKRKK